MALADFDINADGTDAGYEGSNSEAISFTLRASPPTGISSWRLDTWDASGFVAGLPIATNPPRASKNAPELTLVGATSGQSVNPSSLGAAITTTLPSTGAYAWIIRSTVNGGVNSNGSFNPDYVRERMIVIRNSTGARTVVATETTQFEQDGWAGAFDSLLNGLGIGASLGDTEYTSDQTWSADGDIPSGNFFELVLDGPGGGAAGGMIVVGNTAGSSAGSGGARQRKWFTRAQLVALLPIAIVLPAGGAGGAGKTSTSGQTGNDGGTPTGGASIAKLGMFAGAGRGALGCVTAGSNPAGAGGGGSMGNAPTYSIGADAWGGQPNGVSGTVSTGNKNQGAGGGNVSDTDGDDGGSSVDGGGAGGTSGGSTGTDGGDGGSSINGSGGGGASGGASSGGTIGVGGDGGSSGSPGTAGLVAGGGGAAGAGGTPDGTDGAASTHEKGAEGGGAGLSARIGTGGDGGDGGAGGGGGGGGGCVSTDGTEVTSGSGGAGGVAKLIVRRWA